MSDYTESRNEEMIRAIIDDTPYHTDYTQGRNEQILQSIVDNTPYDKEPESRMEELLIELKAKIEGGGEVPEELKQAMNAVLNKKMSTTVNYPPDVWADTVNLLGKLPIRTASGAVASFNDGADGVPLAAHSIDIVATQSGSGDPSPSNPREISGFNAVSITKTGVNIWNEETNISSGEIKMASRLRVAPSTTYYFKSPCAFTAYRYDRTGTVISSVTLQPNATFTTLSNQYYIFAAATVAAYGHNEYQHDVSFNYPSTDHDYHAYVGESVEIALGQTIYGGELDVTTGVLTITKVGYDLKNYNGIIQKAAPGRANAYFRFDDLQPYPGEAGSDLICEKYKTVLINSTTTDVGVYIGKPSTLDHSTLFFRPENPDSYTTDTIMNYIRNTLNGLMCVYELATPQTYQLTPTQINTLLGANNIYCDTGDTTIEYRADIDLLIGGLTPWANYNY